MAERGEIVRNGGKQKRLIITSEGCLEIKRTALKVKGETLTARTVKRKAKTRGRSAAKKGYRWTDT
jgi:hypothetical protein